MLSLLIVEEDQSLADLLTTLFDSVGFEVETLDEIAAARQLLARRSFDSVLVDCSPVTTMQPSLLAQIRGLRTAAPARTTFGLLTTAPRFVRLSARQLGFQFVIDMPFDVDDLIATVRRQVRQPCGQSVSGCHRSRRAAPPSSATSPSRTC